VAFFACSSELSFSVPIFDILLPKPVDFFSISRALLQDVFLPLLSKKLISPSLTIIKISTF